MSTSEKKVREIEVEINEINSKLEDANAAVRAAQRKLNMANSTDGADPVLKQELQNRLAKQQAELNALNAQLAAKEKEANEVADREPTGQPTKEESTKASTETAGDTVREGEADQTGTATSVDEDEGDEDTLSDEEVESIDNEENDGEDDEEATEDDTEESEPEESSGKDTVVGFDENGNPIYETEDGTGKDVVVGFDKDGNPIYATDAVEINSGRAVPTYYPISNPLHDYASYTYNISLFVLDKNEYADMKESPTGFTVGRCLIGGAGRYGSPSRHPDWIDDFYFDGLRLTSIIGMNARTKSSNSIDISFNIIEPYGLTLLDRIINTAATIEPKCRNYLELPYMLQIDFFGHTDDGSMPNPIPNMTKRFVVKFIEMKMKVSTRGAEYAIKAVPFNHQALQESTASIPINLEVDADTVQSFFDDQEAGVRDQIDAKSRAGKDAQNLRDDIEQASDQGGDVASLQEKQKAAAKAASAVIKTSSFTGGINAWYAYQLETQARKAVDRYRFVIDEEIAKSKIVLPQKNDPSKTPVPDPGTDAARKINIKNAAGPNFETSSFSISSGTSIPRLIDMVMRSSSYILDQVSDPANKDPQELANKREEPMWWYKIIPEIALTEFDPNTNRWAKVITYHVKKHIVYNTKHPYGPQTKPKGAVKEYNYLYTGKNTDIIDFQIDFDTLFYTAIEVNRAGYQTTTGAAAPPETEALDTKRLNKIQNPSTRNTPFPQQITFIADDPGASAGIDGNRDSTTKTATSIQKSIYSGARGDMLNLRMKIIGDPHFIKQDDILINPGNPEYDDLVKDQLITEVGSLVMDRGEIFAKVAFRTPTDIDDNTGLVRQDGKYTESVFSGMFRLLTVDSEFRQGKFEQTLNLIRIFDDVLKSAQDASNGRETEDANDGDSRGEEADSNRDPEDDLDDVDSDESDDEESDVVEESSGKDTVVGFDDDGNPIIETNDGTGKDIAQVREDEDESVNFNEDEAEEVELDEWESQGENSQENQPVKSYSQYESQNQIAATSPANSVPTQGVTSVPNGVTQDPVTGTFTYVDSTGAVNNLPASTNEALQAQVNALKDGNPVTYADYDRNSGWVQKTYDPQTQTHTILAPATAPFSIPTDGIRDSSDQVLLMKSTRKADREAREAQAAAAQGVAPKSTT